ncbi:MAG TPA: primosomal protein N' [Candidatus Omnitrophota bacterium]|nr:primosomal protein N' [Candidatus Omnitrophota bacterium]HPS19571.1 primosomal protein N' [Candidatus Omnitrophota bacterium]
MKYVEVVTSLPIDRTFQYAVTGREKFPPEVGKRVSIPFREMTRIGYIVEVEDEPKVAEPKPVLDIIDEKPVFTKEAIELAKWIKERYFCSWGEALEAMIPSAMKHGKISMTTRVLEEKEIIAASKPHVPNAEQEEVLRKINKCIDEKRHEVFLLHGITGSGKTEVYLQAMDNVLSKGKTGIMLVPEISLTPQTVERFVSRFGERIAIFHSKMLESARFNEWARIKDGRARIVVGPRSAVFSPFNDLGLVVIDEEHEPSYKQEDVPRYHAREVAIERARVAGAPVILGSATPSLESFHNAVKGEYHLVELTQRIKDYELPRVKVVDMRMELDTRTGREVISRVMSEALRVDIEKKHQQAIVFLNRRGFSTFVNCRKCGHVIKCKKCDTTLVYHEEKKELICHYCNVRVQPLKMCPECKADNLMYGGTGTQKIESELKNLMPKARIARMDSDSMAKRGAHERVLKEFKEHKLDIIVGTQMIAKGLDFPKVTLVGVVSADANLNLPDFRSGERTFDLITQVAGRAGRGDLDGEVVVQTYTPDNYAISFAAKHDYHGFYDREIEARRQLGFPPFVNLIKITLRSRIEDHVIKNAENLAQRLMKMIPGVDLIGPAPSPMTKLRGYYRWNVIIRTKDIWKMNADLKKALSGFRKSAGVFVAVDVDPMNM